jgi:putative transposase
MALTQSALSELLDAFRTGDGVDMIRESVRTVLQELVEFEAAGVIGAERYERTEDRATERNDSRPKLLATKAGDVELRIPKLRKGSFFPSILEPRRRIDQALYAVVMETPLSTASTASRPAASMTWSSAPTQGSASPRCPGSANSSTSRSARSAPGPLTTSGSPTSTSTRPTSTSATSPARAAKRSRWRSWSPRGSPPTALGKVLGLDVGDSEDETFWRAFLLSLKQRGLAGVRLVISDQHSGLVAALKRSFQGSGHQRCRVHFARNLLAHVPNTHADRHRHGRRRVPHDLRPARPRGRQQGLGTRSATS